MPQVQVFDKTAELPHMRVQEIVRGAPKIHVQDDAKSDACLRGSRLRWHTMRALGRKTTDEKLASLRRMGKRLRIVAFEAAPQDDVRGQARVQQVL